MTIVEMLDRYPRLFYAQSWYRGESFTRILPSETPLSPPTGRVFLGQVPPKNAKLYRAVDLLNCYLKSPGSPLWDDYLWCGDFDAQGQRIYVGGKSNTGVIEIHRHLHLNERFGVPTWT